MKLALINWSCGGTHNDDEDEVGSVVKKMADAMLSKLNNIGINYVG